MSGLWLAIGHAHWGLTLGPVDRAPDRRDDDGRDAVLRSGAVSGGAVQRVGVSSLKS